MNELSKSEVQELQELEATIESGLRDFLRAGCALLMIRDKRLYRQAHATFGDYCREKWEITGARAYQLIQAAEVVSEVSEGSETSTMVDENTPSSHPPKSERQTRALAEAPKGERKAAWKEAVDTAPKGKDGQPKVTAAHVEKVVAKRAEKPTARKVLPTDEAGTPIDDEEIQRAFAGRDDVRAFMRDVSALKRRFAELCEQPAGRYGAPRQKQFDADVNNLHALLRFCLPYGICPYCGGRKCDACKQVGWMPEDVYKNVPANLKPQGGVR